MQNPNNSPDLSSGQFSVDKPSIPSVPVPQASPMNTAELASANQAGATRLAGAEAASKGSSSSSGGFNPMSLLGPIGSIIGSIFAEGGVVTNRPLAGDKANGFAAGGPAQQSFAGDENAPPIEPPGPQPESQTNGMDPLTIGYLTGALHEAKYGGTPDTLTKAAQEIKARLGQPMQETQMEPPAAAGMAAGGVADDTQLAQAALMKAMGLGPGSEDQMQAQPQVAPTQPQVQPQVAPTQPIQAKASPQPYARGYADGGPNQPLGPGQAFEGDGKVEGPGGPEDDEIPAKLSNGEFVFSQPAVQFFGVDKLVKMNEQGKQGFMQAMQQVQGNQPQQGQPQVQAPGAPVASPMPPGKGMMQSPMPPSGQPQAPMMQAAGGPSITMKKGSGYAGL